MSLIAVIAVAFGALFRNKLRSLLTILGVVIGIAAVIAMVSVGQGARAQVAKVFEGMGTNLINVLPGSTNVGGMQGGGASSQTLTWGDLQSLGTELSAVRWVAPLLSSKQQASSDDANWNTSMSGTLPDFFKIRNWPIQSGRLFDLNDDANGNKVAVIGLTIVKQLYPTGDPIGQTLRVKGVPFEIVGVLAEKGLSPQGQDYDDAIYIPAHTYQSKIDRALGNSIKGQIMVSAITSEDTDRAEDQVEGLLRDRHKLKSGDDDDFKVRNLSEIAKARSASTDTITTMLAIVAFISLLVGGIGVMNIMLVSVVERTREIGIRMAVGARPRDVLIQFLVEALILGGLGGALGLGIGAIAASMLATKFQLPSNFPAETAVLAIVVSCGIGIVFGLYPALKASRLDPIVALRYES